MSKFMTLNKQVEERAEKWFFGEQKEENRGIAKKWFEENKKEVMQEYLEKHPKIKKQYQSKKKQLTKIALLATTGTIAIATLSGVYTAKNKQKENEVEIEQEMQFEENEGKNTVEETENPYESFLEEARNIENTRKREEMITDQTKQIIVEAYNQENPESPITKEQLQTLILNEFVLQKADRVGNYTYERVPQNVQYEQNETQKLVKKLLYDFRIDGKTVAVFDKNGNVIPDKNVEEQDMSFQKMISIMNQSTNLKEAYRYKNSDSEIKNVEQSYITVADSVLGKTTQTTDEKTK